MKHWHGFGPKKFGEGFRAEVEQSSTTPVPHFGFAEYSTFARVIPFERTSLEMESLGHITTASGRGKSGYFHYESAAKTLEAGLRESMLRLVNISRGEE